MICEICENSEFTFYPPELQMYVCDSCYLEWDAANWKAAHPEDRNHAL